MCVWAKKGLDRSVEGYPVCSIWNWREKKDVVLLTGMFKQGDVPDRFLSTEEGGLVRSEGGAEDQGGSGSDADI